MNHSIHNHLFFQRLGLIVALAAVFIALVAPQPAHAITASPTLLNTYTSCPSNDATVFTGRLSVPQDTYDVYVHLQKRGQVATVQTYGELNDNDGNCYSIGTPIVVNGDSWTHVGVWGQISTPDQTIFQIVSDEQVSTLDANRPSVMLVSQTNPVCVPTAQCLVTVDGQQGYVSPPGSLTTQDSLHVVRAIDPAQDTVEKVTYYVNNNAVYSTATLQPFDLRYVKLSNQTLSRVIQYASGQQVVLQQTPPDNFSDSFHNFLFRIFLSNPKTLPTILWVGGLSILGGILLGIAHAIRKHRSWELDHGLIHQRYALITDKDRRTIFMRDHITTIIRRVIEGILLFILIFVAVVVINTYVMTLFKVNGKSMESTYLNGVEVFVNKLPITWAHLSGIDYTPKRGDVVILHAVYGVTDPQTASSQEDYIIKRVIGLPGEHVLVKNSTITIFNIAHPEGFQPDLGSSWAKTYHANDPDEDVDLVLGTDELFVSGDNRPVSVDSRFNGPIKTSEIVGQALFKVWPLN